VTLSTVSLRYNWRAVGDSGRHTCHKHERRLVCLDIGRSVTDPKSTAHEDARSVCNSRRCYTSDSVYDLAGFENFSSEQKTAFVHLGATPIM